MDREDWNKRYSASDFVWTVNPNQFVVAETVGLRPGHAVDLAGGEGRNAIWLAERGWQVTAVDFSEVAVEKGRQLAESRAVRVDWVVADLAKYALRSGFYDLVLVCYLQIPEPERRLILGRARQAVAPGGTFLWIAHDLSNLEHGVGGPKSPAVLCSPQDVVADLPGFEIQKAEVVQRRVQRDELGGGPEEAVALDTLVRAVRRSVITVRHKRRSGSMDFYVSRRDIRKAEVLSRVSY